MSCSAIGRQGPRFSASLLVAVQLNCAPLSLANAGEHAGLADAIRDRLQEVSAQPAPAVQGEYLASVGDLVRLYRDRAFTPVWIRGGQLRPQAGELQAVIQSAGREGMDPHDYHFETIQRIVKQGFGKADLLTLAEADLMFTDALITYAGDVRQGRVRIHPLRAGVAADIAVLDVRLLLSSAFSDGVAAAMSSLVPRSPAYAGLREALPRYHEMSRAEIPFSIPDRTLEKGDTGAAVVGLKRRLLFLGDLLAAGNSGDAFDERLERAVARFQTRHGLKVDGIVGPKTNAALAVPAAHRASQIRYNLERLRWLPQTLGLRYIVVNIAAFSLALIERGKPALRMRVIVGKPRQQTPVFSSSVTSLVLNPYWNVPHSIATKEILPRLRRDPGYLQRENMRVLRRGGHDGLELDPAAIDWQGVSRANFPYRLRQEPGPDNALGRVKFFLPNPHSVFIHDTPAKALFSRPVRSFSHGCVRLEKPLELAAYLLRDQPEWGGQTIVTALDRVRDKWVNLTQPVPIHMVYWTAWVDSQGIIHFRDDIYRRDQHLSLALEATSFN